MNPSQKLISVTELTAYMFCPRKLWLSKVHGLREPPTREMILGRIKHRALEIFTISEKDFIKSLSQGLTSSEINEKYKQLMRESAIYAFQENADNASKFSLTLTTFLAEFLPNTEEEIKIRVLPLLEALKSFHGRDIWENLNPKYSSELSIESFKLGLKGRVDRVEFSKNNGSEKIIPYEIKTRQSEEVYESDKIQLAAYSLLLEDKMNKPIPLGVIELRKSKKQIEISNELKSKVFELIEKVKNLKGEFPSSFSKCAHCKLKKECNEL